MGHLPGPSHRKRAERRAAQGTRGAPARTVNVADRKWHKSIPPCTNNLGSDLGNFRSTRRAQSFGIINQYHHPHRCRFPPTIEASGRTTRRRAPRQEGGVPDGQGRSHSQKRRQRRQGANTGTVTMQDGQEVQAGGCGG